MKKAVTAAALCSVAAAAGSMPTTTTTILTACLRGGADEEPAVPTEPLSNATTTTPTTTSAPKKRRKKKKPIDNNQALEQPDPFLEELLLLDDYYDILGLSSQDASKEQIKKAYRKRAVQTHPDKTSGDRRAFDKVSRAYEVLTDESQKQIYDQHGKRGLENQGAASNGPEDLFRHFFGQQQQHRNRTVRYQLEVTLEDLYQGMERSILVEQPLGRKQVDIQIPKGTSSGESIYLSGEHDGVPNLVFLLQQRPHATFTRKGHDLVTEVHISLDEAIGGVTKREFTHLDGRKIQLQSARDSLWIQTGDVQVLKGEGMPKRDSESEYGDLYMHFKVDLPNSASAARLSVEERGQLQILLRKMNGKTFDDVESEEDIQTLEKAKLSDVGRGPFRRREERQNSFYWSNGGSNPFFGGHDDGSNVECQQM
jgi:DnaJ-class molecular chaperone